MKASTSGVSRKSGTAPFISERPRKRSEKPTTSSLMWRRLSLFERLKIKPNAISGTAKSEMSALKPSNDTIHAVIVVPIFAPIITPTACVSVNRPAFTKPTVITVVADED